MSASPSSAVRRILLPLDANVDQDSVLLPATVLSSWFGAPIEIVCREAELVTRCEILASGLGVRTDPVVDLGDPTDDGLLAHIERGPASLVIAEPSPSGMAIAARSAQPVFLVADELGRRLDFGPIVTEITGADGDLDALALTAAICRSLDQPARLVVATTDPSGLIIDTAMLDRLVTAKVRLRHAGCDVGVDSMQGNEEPPLVLVGRTRSATAIVVPQERLVAPEVDQAIQRGVSVIIAPPAPAGTERYGESWTDGDASDPPNGVPSTLDVLSRAVCLEHLERNTVARIGYVEAGWPIIVPVNYRFHQGDVFFRSLDGGKLRAAERGDTVCLELDGVDEILRTGWSVVAHGDLEIVSDAPALRQAWDVELDSWVADDEWRWLRMRPFSINGRRVAGEVTSARRHPSR